VKRLAAMLGAMCLLAASCGGSGVHLATATKTRACLVGAGVRIGGQLDFVASTATGGAFKAHFPDDDVTVVFGETVADADNINDAYQRFHSKNVGIEDVLKQQANVVMLWRLHPSDQDIAQLTGCLK
jgi:hypothetical protein